MPKFEVRLTRLESYLVWGEVEADSELEARRKASNGEYKETFRKYQDCSFQEVQEIIPEEGE